MNRTHRYHLDSGEALFQSLADKAKETKGELSTHWFDQHLFKCRSANLQDYIDEAKKNWKYCQQLGRTNEQNDWLLKRLDNQLQALISALYKNKLPCQKTTQ